MKKINKLFIKNIKRLFKFITDFIFLVSNVRQLEADVENLEVKLLAPEKVNSESFWGESLLSWNYSWYGKKMRKITLEEKVDAIIELFNIEFEQTKEKESEVIAIKKRKKSK